MYFKAPETVLNSFAIREDLFRIRIDDIQHFMDGYYLYWKNYDALLEHQERLRNEAAAENEEENEPEETEDTDIPETPDETE